MIRTGKFASDVINEAILPQEAAIAMNILLDEVPEETTEQVEQQAHQQTQAAYSVPNVQIAILNFIKKLEGYRIRLREFHWSVTKASEHELTNSLMGKIEAYEDSIAEDMQGFLGIRIQVGDIVPVLPPNNLSLNELIKSITKDTIVIKTSLEGMNINSTAGIESLLDDITHDCNVAAYLSTFS